MYSTALAFTGKSAACAMVKAHKLAAEPQSIPLIVSKMIPLQLKTHVHVAESRSTSTYVPTFMQVPAPASATP